MNVVEVKKAHSLINMVCSFFLERGFSVYNDEGTDPTNTVYTKISGPADFNKIQNGCFLLEKHESISKREVRKLKREVELNFGKGKFSIVMDDESEGKLGLYYDVFNILDAFRWVEEMEEALGLKDVFQIDAESEEDNDSLDRDSLLGVSCSFEDFSEEQVRFLLENAPYCLCAAKWESYLLFVPISNAAYSFSRKLRQALGEYALED